jgi:branched-chain amino acid transport system ATP-binding protein
MSTPTTPRLRIADLVVRYGRSVAVKGVDLTVHKGGCVGIVGANGAGKSSFLKAIAGVVKPASGAVELDGVDMAGRTAWSMARSGVRLVPETRELFWHLTVTENLHVGTRLVPRRERGEALDTAFELFPALAKFRGTQAFLLSGGQQQMLAIGRALVGRPELLLLDEPSLGLAPVVVEELIEALRRISSTGVSMVIAEQNLLIPRTLCDRVSAFNLGAMVAEGTPAEVLNESTLRLAFLSLGQATPEERMDRPVSA